MHTDEHLLAILEKFDGWMREGDYIFAPLADPLKIETGSEAGDWRAARYLSSSQLLGNLKLYGRLAGIAEDKLTLMALRRTAMRLRLEEGGSLGEMQVFLVHGEAGPAQALTGKLAAAGITKVHYPDQHESFEMG